MSIEVSERFKAAMKAPVKTVSLEVAFDGATYTSNDVLTKAVMQASGYYFGVATKSLSLSLIGVDFNLMGKTGLATLKVKDGNAWESCVLGRFKVLEQTVDLEKEMTSIKAYDAIGVVAEKYYLEGGLVFPTTVNHLASQLASASGMDYDEIELVNGTYSISEDLYAKINNITYRDILAEVAGASANLAMVRGSDDALNFVAPMMEPVDSLSYGNLKKIKFEPKYGKVSSVVLARTPQEDNIAVIDDDIVALPSGKNLIDCFSDFHSSVNGLTSEIDSNGIITTTGIPTADYVTVVGYVDITNLLEDGEAYILSMTNKNNYLWAEITGEPTSGSKKYYSSRANAGAGNTGYSTPLVVDKSQYPKYRFRVLSSTMSNWGSNSRTLTSGFQLEKATSMSAYECFKPNGLVELKLANNEILDDDRESLAQPILEAIKGFGFTPFEATTEGHGWHEIGDRIRIFNDTPNIPVEYQEVEYIQTTGTQYIDTGFRPTPLTKTRMEWMFTSTTVQQRVFAVAQSGTGLIYQMYANGGFGMGVAYQNNTGQWTNANTPITVNEKMIYELDGKNKKATGYRGDGTQVGTRNLSSYTATQVATYPLRLMAEAKADGTGARNYSTGRFYSCKIWDDDVLVRDFVPCYRKSDNVAGLYDKVNGVFYTNAGTGAFTVGAKAGVDVDFDSLADIIVTDIKLTIDGGLKEELKGIAPDETQTNYALAGGIKKTIYNTEIKVDKQGQEITSIVSRQDTFEDETLENFTQVVQNISSVVTTIQSTGGGNLIHNSVGYNKDTDGALINWTQNGSVGSETSPESVSYGAISGNQIDLGASSSIVQRIVVDSSGAQKYSLGFKAKKGATGVATVHLRNDIDDYYIAIPANESVLWESYGLAGVTPHMAYFDVVVETDSEVTDFAISDLILTVGDSNTPWVSASDEILSKSVAVDGSGVTVKSSSNGDYVQLDELGLNGYSDATGSLENVFTVNRDLTEVSKLKARNQITMPPLKIVPVTSGDRAGWSFVKESE